MEFEKLQEIIAEVLNLEPDDITMGATFSWATGKFVEHISQYGDGSCV